jgi:hypothetical protein
MYHNYLKSLIFLLILLLPIDIFADSSETSKGYNGSIDFNIKLLRVEFQSYDQGSPYSGTMEGLNSLSIEKYGSPALNITGGLNVFKEYAESTFPDSCSFKHPLYEDPILGGGSLSVQGEAIADLIKSGVYLDGLWTIDNLIPKIGTITLTFEYTYEINLSIDSSSEGKYNILSALFSLDKLNPHLRIIDTFGEENALNGSIAFYPDSNSGKGTFSITLDNNLSSSSIKLNADILGQAKGDASILSGDVNGDDKIDLADSLMVLKILTLQKVSGVNRHADRDKDYIIGLENALKNLSESK